MWFQTLFSFSILYIFGSICAGSTNVEISDQSSQLSSNSSSDDLKCQFLCPVGKNSQPCSGHGTCNCYIGYCNCEPERIGNACQYHQQMMTCESLRYCVQCRAYGTGPFAEDHDCEEFCANYPVPLIVGKLNLRRHEILCSFIDSTNATSCRFYFKLVKTRRETSSEEKIYNRDVYIVAKRDTDCDADGKRYFPHSAIVDGSSNDLVSTEELIKHVDDEDIQKNSEKSYATMFIILLFIALPFLTCIVSCVQNFTSLPCGLCNMFRRPSSRYLRNVRAYPDNGNEFQNPLVFS